MLARRLVEAGVQFIGFNEFNHKWDTHGGLEGRYKQIVPEIDRGFAILVADLKDRGLLDTTLVAMFGEFGRTPRINKDAGRDHWEKVFSVMLAGGGLKSGIVLGSSTRDGDLPLDRPVHLNDVLATIYHQLGVSCEEVIHDELDRPFPVLPHGTAIPELL